MAKNSNIFTATREASCRENLGLSAPPAATGTQERLAVLDPEALAKTFSDVLKAISKDAATAVIKSLYQNVTHDIAPQAD